MNSRRPFTLLAAALFAVMTVIHIYRIATNFQIILGNHSLPMTASWIALLATGILAVMLYRESQR